MQPIQGRGRGKGRVDRRGRGQDGEGGHGTPEPTLPTSILPYTYPSPDSFIRPQIYISPSIPPHTYISLPSPVSPKQASMAIDITLPSHLLSSPTLPPIDETMVNLVSELGAFPFR